MKFKKSILFISIFQNALLSAQTAKPWFRGEFPTLVVENSLFVGTTNGLYQYHFEEDTWTRFGIQNGLSDDCIQLLSWDGEWLWTATGKGAACGDIKLNKWLVFDQGNGPPSHVVTSFAFQGDYVWAGTDRGAARFDKLIQEWETFTVHDGLSDSLVYDIVTDGDLVYFATAKGLSEYNSRFEKWRYYGNRDGIVSDTIRFIYPSGEYLWLFTERGISRFSKKLHSTVSFTGDPRLCHAKIRDLAVDGEQLWLATGDGVLIFDPSNAVWRDFPEQTNLPSRSVVALAFSQENRWFLTESGPILFNTTLKTWQPFDKSRGLSSDRYNTASLFQGRLFLVNAETIEHYRSQENRWYVYPLYGSGTTFPKKSWWNMGGLENGFVQLGAGMKMGLSGTRFTIRQENSYEYDISQRVLSKTARHIVRSDMKGQIVLPSERTLNGYYDNTDFTQTFYGMKYQGKKGDVLQEANWGDIRYEQGRSSLFSSLGLFGVSGRVEMGKKTERYKRSLFSAKGFSGQKTTAAETDFYTGNVEGGTFQVRDIDFIRNRVYRMDTTGSAQIPIEADVQVYVDDGDPSTNTANTVVDHWIGGIRGDFDRFVPQLDYWLDLKKGEIWFTTPLNLQSVAATRIVSGSTIEERVLKTSGNQGLESMNHYSVGGMDIIPSSFRMALVDSSGIQQDLSELGLDQDHDGRVDPECTDYKSGVLTIPNAKTFPEGVYDPDRPTSYYQLVFTFQSRLSIFRLSHSRLLRGSETVIVDGDVLLRGEDYVLDYTAGSLLILKQGTVAEDSEIEIRYEYYRDSDEKFFMAGFGFSPSDNMLVEVNGYGFELDNQRNHGLDMVGEFKWRAEGLDFKIAPEMAMGNAGSSVHVRTDVSSATMRIYSEMERNDQGFVFPFARKIRSGGLRDKHSLGGTVYPLGFLDISGSWIKQSAFPAVSPLESRNRGVSDEEEYGGRALLNKNGLPTVSISARRKSFDSPGASSIKNILKADMEYDVPKLLLRKLLMQSARFYGILRRSIFDESAVGVKRQFDNRYFRMDVTPADLIQINAYYRAERSDQLSVAGLNRPLDQNQKWFFDATMDRVNGINFSSRGESEVLTQYSGGLQNTTLQRSWQNNLRIYPGKWVRPLTPFVVEFNYQPQWSGYLRNRSRALGFFDTFIRFLDDEDPDRSEKILFYQFRGEWRPSALFWYYASLDWNRIFSRRVDSRLFSQIRTVNQKAEIRPAANTAVIVQYFWNEENRQAVSRTVRHNPLFWVENRWNPRLQTKMNLVYFREERSAGRVHDWVSNLSAMLGFTYRIRSSGASRLEIRNDLSASFYRTSRRGIGLNSNSYSNTAWMDFYPSALLILRFRASASFRDQLDSDIDFFTGAFELRLTAQF